MNYTDTQLKAALAKMLPETLYFNIGSQRLCWISKQSVCGTYVLDTELLHLCWLVEETLNDDEIIKNDAILFSEIFPTWRATYEQRTIALAKVKGIEIR